MAYMSQEMKKELAPKIKEICKQYGISATLAVHHYQVLVLNIRKGKIDFLKGSERGYEQVNQYHIQDHYKDNPQDHYKDNPKAAAFLSEVNEAMNIGNYDNSDRMTDYFDVGFYTEINIGKWNKPYVYEG